jgi:hypothetical protein
MRVPATCCVVHEAFQWAQSDASPARIRYTPPFFMSAAYVRLIGYVVTGGARRVSSIGNRDLRERCCRVGRLTLHDPPQAHAAMADFIIVQSVQSRLHMRHAGGHDFAAAAGAARV